MITFDKKEIKFLKSMEECRVATSHGGIPHVKPVSYIFEDGLFLIATDYKTRMYKNVLANPHAAITIDVYHHGSHKAVLVQGKIAIVDDGDEFARIFKKFHEKFEWVRNEPWDEKEAPFIVLRPFSKTSWGLK
jgi:nitroimidazol reductase NimA-like FMN-containing flavoprotein (pyridoxamine 5'-phosphate oxidase superfamily)